MTGEIDVGSMINSFKERLDAGEHVPSVEVPDLKYFWKRWHQVKQGPGVGIGMGAFGDDNPFYKLGERHQPFGLAVGFWIFCSGRASSKNGTTERS